MSFLESQDEISPILSLVFPLPQYFSAVTILYERNFVIMHQFSVNIWNCYDTQKWVKFSFDLIRYTSMPLTMYSKELPGVERLVEQIGYNTRIGMKSIKQSIRTMNWLQQAH